MKTKRNIIFLSENGLSSNFISKLNDNQVRVLVEKFKKETKEVTMVSSTDSATQSKLQSEKKPYEVYEKTEVDENSTPTTTPTYKTPTTTPTYKTPTKGEMKERFESKSQQNFFWAKCNTSKGVKKQKWCEMAKELEKTTSKHKKEETNENLQKYIENTIVEMLENEVDARISKKDLLGIIKKPKKVTMFSDESPMELPIAKMFSIGKSKK